MMPWLWIIWLASLCTIASGIRDHRRSPNVEDRVNFRNFPLDLVTESSGNSKKAKPEDDRKTLSHQVADGKYGLLQHEFFSKPIKRPGVLSYDNNKEVPKDNSKNYGGLNESEIWLAENHLLVLRGGGYPTGESYPDYSKPLWPPIDDYSAPRRQVKIPKNPKVPPPFPVQFTDNGPLQIVGTNFTRTLNDSPSFAISPLDGYNPETPTYLPPEYKYSTNSTAGEAPFPGPPYPPQLQGGFTPGNGVPQLSFPVNGGLPPYFESLPPGSVVLPPPSNKTEDYDEDDLSIYYPPPYSFYYPVDNSTVIPPGPLVPGIVLPPPPDFFATFPPPTTAVQPPKVHRTTTSAPQKNFYSTFTTPTTAPPTKAYRTTTPAPSTTTQRPKLLTTKPTITRIRPVYQHTESPQPAIPVKTPQPTQRNKTVSVTILRPVKPTKPPPIYIYENDIPNKPFEEYGPPSRYNKKISITTTRVPLRAYFTTSSDDIDSNLVTRLPEKAQRQKLKPKPQNQIYYYEDTELSNAITPYPVVTQKQQQQQYYNASRNYFPKNENYDQYVPTRLQQQQYYYVPNKQYVTQRPQYRIVHPNPTYQSNSNFKSHLIKLQEQIQAYQKPPGEHQASVFQLHNNAPSHQETVFSVNQPNQNVPSSKPVYQYSFEVANYKEQHAKFKTPQEQDEPSKYQILPHQQYSVQIEPAVEITTTQRPQYQASYQEVPNRPSKYYTNGVRNYNYRGEPQLVAATPTDDETYTVTPNPVYQPYYTKQEDNYYDDITKKYFTAFGRKIPISTTPLPNVKRPEPPQPIFVPPNPNVRIRNRPSYNPPVSIVNYVGAGGYIQQPYQQQNPKPQFSPQYQQPDVPIYQEPVENYRQVKNYRQKLPIQAIGLPSREPNDDKTGSFISYQLPGDDGAHFYFLTPQLTQKNERRGGITYYYAQPAASNEEASRRTRGY